MSDNGLEKEHDNIQLMQVSSPNFGNRINSLHFLVIDLIN